MGRFQILTFSESAIEHFQQLKALRLGVKHMDLRIAAIALESDCILVTANTKDFHGVPGLRVEDWTTS